MQSNNILPLIFFCNIRKSFKGKVTDRIFNEKIKTENSSTVMNGSKKYPILKSFKFFIHKTDEISSDDLKKRITSLGGSVTKKYEEDVLAVISTNGKSATFKFHNFFLN